MFVAVIHQIQDPERFRAAEAEAIARGLPPGMALPIEFTTPDDKTGISIWQGRSIDAVRRVVEAAVGGCSDTEYLELEVRGLWDRCRPGEDLASHEPPQDGPRRERPGRAEPGKARGFSGPSGFALMRAWSERAAG